VKEQAVMNARHVVLLALMLSGAARAEVKEFVLPTAADGNVKFYVDSVTKLPIGAEDDKAHVMTAAFAFVPTPKGEMFRWTWQYQIAFKTGKKVERIEIEDERDAQLRLLIDDRHPELEGATWTGYEQSIKMSEDWLKVMQEPAPWLLLRRITITYGDGDQSRLHQMVVQTRDMRMKVLDKLLSSGESR
jgi:hypothetical protein